MVRRVHFRLDERGFNHVADALSAMLERVGASATKPAGAPTLRGIGAFQVRNLVTMGGATGIGRRRRVHVRGGSPRCVSHAGSRH
jgi:hypothetical protein